jgi:predicted  nucleic acid-binding Zn-ribbon protein
LSSNSVADLLAVQDLDAAADQLRHRRVHLLERAQLAEIDGRIASLRAESSGVEAKLADVGARQSAAEAELAATEQRATSVSKRLYGGEVSASRELSAMAAELDQLKERSSGLEDDVLLLMEEREPLEARASELAAALESLGGERDQVAASLSDAETVVDAELADLSSRRAGAAATVPAALLETYERLRTRLGGIGVARLVGNHCDGCHLTLSAMELDRIRHLPEGEVVTCEQCSRILVPAR